MQFPAAYCVDSHERCYQAWVFPKTRGLYLEFLPWSRIVAIMNSCSWMWVEPSSTGNWWKCETWKSTQENWDVIEWKLWAWQSAFFVERSATSSKLRQLTQNYWVEFPLGVFSCDGIHWFKRRFLQVTQPRPRFLLFKEMEQQVNKLGVIELPDIFHHIINFFMARSSRFWLHHLRLEGKEKEHCTNHGRKCKCHLVADEVRCKWWVISGESLNLLEILEGWNYPSCLTKKVGVWDDLLG